MPFVTKWEDNPLFLTYGGVDVYHVFRDDDVLRGPSQALFSLSPSTLARDAFDVKDLPQVENMHPRPPYIHTGANSEERQKLFVAWDRWNFVQLPENNRRVIENAIDRGELK